MWDSYHGPLTRRYDALIDNCRSELKDRLETLRDVIHKSPDVYGKKIQKQNHRLLGIRLWVVPPPYHRLVSQDSEVRLAALDFLGQARWCPSYKMMCAGYLPMKLEPEHFTPSPVEWQVGKGNISNIALTHEWKDVTTTARVIIHDVDFPQGIESISKNSFFSLPGATRRGLSQEDFKHLRQKFGAAVFVPLVADRSSLPIGTIAVHAPAAHPLTKDQGLAIGQILSNESGRVGKSATTGLANHIASKIYT